MIKWHIFNLGEFNGFVRVGPKRYFFPQKYRQEAAKIYNMPVRSSDVFVASYPRSGNIMNKYNTFHLIFILNISRVIYNVVEDNLSSVLSVWYESLLCPHHCIRHNCPFVSLPFY